MNTHKKQYIAPGEVRKINGIEVRAKEVSTEMDLRMCPCSNCITADQNICFDKKFFV